jgi:membrane-bound lytic murein transglycosylase B
MTGFFQRLDGDARDGLGEVAGEIGRPTQLLPEQFAGKTCS